MPGKALVHVFPSVAQNSTLNCPLRRSAGASATVALPFTPSKETAPLASAPSAPVAPSVTPPEYTPFCPLPDASAAVVPDVSPSRQYATGASAITAAAYGDVGVTAGDGDDAAPAPLALDALTVNVYAAPAVSPLSLDVRVEPFTVAVAPP